MSWAGRAGSDGADVAVVIPAWNAEGTLARAVESALAQANVAVEVVIVDDASTDRTAEIARALAAADPRVRLIVQERNAGPGAARNRAMATSTAPWICPLDSDDFMEPGRLSALLTIAWEGDWDFVVDDLWKVLETDPEGPRRRLFSLGEFVRANLSDRHGDRGEMGFLKPMMRRDFLRQHRLDYAENMRLGEDYDLYARALAAGARWCLTDPLGYVATVRELSLSGTATTRDYEALVQADDRLLALDLPADDRRTIRAHRIECFRRWRWLWLIDAVKARDPVAVVRCFRAPPAVFATLVALLAEQAWLRGSRLVARAPFAMRARLPGRPAPNAARAEEPES
jgi:succinoglycan biosynthesis protein ExoU